MFCLSYFLSPFQGNVKGGKYGLEYILAAFQALAKKGPSSSIKKSCSKAEHKGAFKTPFDG